LFAVSGVLPDPHTGHIALSAALTSGSVPVEMSDRLADALECPRDIVDAVIATTEAQRPGRDGSGWLRTGIRARLDGFLALHPPTAQR
jgi:hypothetical protein